MIERNAKLLKTGSYPDKNIDLTEADLDKLVGSFSEVPVKIEHEDTPFDGFLGVVKRIWRVGKELFGSIGFTKEAWDLIDKCGADKLSVGMRRDKTGLTEVSLVKRPRISGAALMNDSINFHNGMFCKTQDSQENEEANMTTDSGKDKHSLPGTIDFAKRVEELETELRDKKAQTKVDALLGRGKITPASVEFAKTLLMAEDENTVAFGEEKTSIADLFSRFVESLPPVVSFSEMAAVSNTEHDFDKAERDVLEKLGISEEDASRIMKGGNR